jgi:hypothetical protein
MYCFQHADKGAVHPAEIPIPGRRGGAQVAVDLGVPVIGLRRLKETFKASRWAFLLYGGEKCLYIYRDTLWGCLRMLILY